MKSAAAHKPPVVRPDAKPGRRADAAIVNVSVLVGSLIVLTLSTLLTVPGEGRVNHVFLPFVHQPLPETCATKSLFGFECPGCGMTRSFISIADGDLVRAWIFNPAGILVFLIVAGQIPFRSYQLWRLWKGRPPVPMPYSSWLVALVGVVVILQWIIRTSSHLW